MLVSVKLDGTDRRTHLRFSLAEEAVVSPDGRWVAFNELHNAYVTALPEIGKDAIDVALDGAALPLGQLTDEGGEWVSWADGGRTVTWIFGPTYHRLALDKAVPTPKPGEASGCAAEADKATKKKGPTTAKKDEKKKLPESDQIEIVLTRAARAARRAVVAYTGARIVTMKGDEVIENGVIVVEGNRIKAVGAAGSVQVPAGATSVDVTGRTIIPGLFDEHAHLHYSTLDVFPQRPWKYLANLAYGVTTTHDPPPRRRRPSGRARWSRPG